MTQIGRAQGNYPLDQRLESPAYIRLRRAHSRSSRLIRSQIAQGYPTAIAVPITAATPASFPHPWLSGRNLDLCLLAVCSCVLAVLCHQTMPLSINSNISTPSALSTSSTSPNQLDFTVKAGLFTTSQQKDDWAGERQDDRSQRE